MKIWDKIKSLFGGNKKNLLPEAQNNYTMDAKPPHYTLIRDDGSTLEIWPKQDRVGNQMYQQVFNMRTNQMQCIPEFCVYSEELKDLINNPAVLSHTILMDIDPSVLADESSRNYIANAMLNSERMGKVINQYKSYAGGFREDENGEYSKYIDNGIIQSLAATKEENARRMQEEYKRREEAELARIKEEAKNIPVNYKTSHAEELSE